MKNKILLSVLFGLLLVGGWYSQFSKNYQVNREYNSYVNRGDEKYERTLYQEAIENYQAAFNLKESQKVMDKLLQTYEKFYDETGSNATRSAWIQKLDEACSVYPNVSQYWEDEIELCIEAEDYDKALTVCKKAYSEGISTEKYIELKNQVKYSYSEKTEYYSEYRNAVNGYFIAAIGSAWRWITGDGEDYSDDYVNLGYIGEDTYFLCETEGGEICFYDLDGVKRGIVTKDISDFGMYSEGYCSVKYGDDFAFVDLEGEVLKDKLEECGSFQNGKAPIKLEDGTWEMLARDGICEMLDVEQIVYDYAGRYDFDGVVIVKAGGKYQFWDANLEKQINEFSCNNIDIPTADKIVAYEDENGKWGYVDYNGKVVIEPQYEQAKSFSNGLAAVMIDGKWGYIDKNNNMVVECQYLDGGYLSEQGACFVSDKEGYYKMIVFRFPDLIQ